MNRFYSLVGICLICCFASGCGTMRGGRYNPNPTPSSVVIGVKGGPIVCAAKGTFPSVIYENISKKGSGDIGEQFAQSGTGSRWGLTMLFPFTPTVGLSADIGSMIYKAKYSGGDALVPTDFTAQTLQMAFGIQVNVYSDSLAFKGMGLRSIYLDGGVDISAATLHNTITAAAFTDTSATATPVSTTGSFANNSAFGTLTGLRASAGMRFAVSLNWELQVEAGYTLALNKVFSSDALRNNTFSVNNFGAQFGIGYRF